MPNEEPYVLLLSRDDTGQWNAKCNDLNGYGETPQDATDDLLDQMTEVGYF